MIKIKLLTESAIMPRLGTEGAAGYDLFTPESFTLAPMQRKLIKLGISTEFAPDVMAQIWPRSGLAYKHGIHVFRQIVPSEEVKAGLLDSDYRGEVGVVLINLGDQPVEFKAGDAIAQMVFSPVLHDVIEHTGKVSETARGAGGFGSTDEVKNG